MNLKKILTAFLSTSMLFSVLNFPISTAETDAEDFSEPYYDID